MQYQFVGYVEKIYIYFFLRIQGPGTPTEYWVQRWHFWSFYLLSWKAWAVHCFSTFHSVYIEYQTPWFKNTLLGMSVMSNDFSLKAIVLCTLYSYWDLNIFAERMMTSFRKVRNSRVPKKLKVQAVAMILALFRKWMHWPLHNPLQRQK